MAQRRNRPVAEQCRKIEAEGNCLTAILLQCNRLKLASLRSCFLNTHFKNKSNRRNLLRMVGSLQSLIAVLMCLAVPASSVVANDELQKAASWTWPDTERFAASMMQMLDERGASEELRAEVEQFWARSEADARGPVLLDRVLTAAGLIDDRIDALRTQLSVAGGAAVQLGDHPWLSSEAPGWLLDSIRLASGRRLAQNKLYDEALEALSGLAVDQVCDPSTLLFYRAVSQHHLLQSDACIESLNVLLEREDELPVRYRSLAKLMLADITKLKEDSLDEVGRLMRDVERRLQLGRLGTRVRDQEDLIVKKLDKMIEDIEEQLKNQKQQQQESSGSQAAQPGAMKPMDDSRVAGGTGSGDVDEKDIGDRAGWGNLPPAQRQESLQRMSEQLPSHYRDIIEGYFRQLAKEKK